MTRAVATILFSLLFAITFASPVKHIRKRSFKVHRELQSDYVPNGKAAMRRAYLKFGLGDIAFKPEGEAAARIRATTAVYANAQDSSNPGTEDGSTPAVGTQNDAQFLSPVMVGGQKLTLNFDSGSADTWVFNTNVPPERRTGHAIYDPTKSTTFKSFNNARFTITYGDGSSCSGPVGFDTVDVGGSTVSQQAIGIPNEVSDSFVEDSASDGLVGLAFSTLNTIEPKRQKTFFDNIVNDLTLPLFTAQLKGGTVGSYEFGRIDETAFVGKLTQVPIDNSRGFWEFDSKRAIANGKNLTLSLGKAIADTGTSLMLVEESFAESYWAQVRGASQDSDSNHIFPCDADLPDLQVAVGPDYLAVVPGSFLNFADIGNNLCFGGLQSSNDLPFYIFGDVWFKSQFVAFQATGPSLGIAPHS